MCCLSIAVNNRIKKGNNWIDDPCYIDVIAFGKLAERMGQNVDKGHSVLVAGRLQFRSWTDARVGLVRARHETLN